MLGCHSGKGDPQGKSELALPHGLFPPSTASNSKALNENNSVEGIRLPPTILVCHPKIQSVFAFYAAGSYIELLAPHRGGKQKVWHFLTALNHLPRKLKSTKANGEGSEPVVLIKAI